MDISAPPEFLEEDDFDEYGVFESQCIACDLYTRVDDLGLCEECAGKLDRDMIRERDWDYSATAWACPEEKREELRDLIIKEYGAKLELIAPSGGSKPKKRKRRRRRRKASKK